jgi:hypothetical protein
MQPSHRLSDLQSLKDLKQQLVEIYGEDVEIFAGRHQARFIPEDVPQHVISRVFQGRHLLRPCRELNRIIAGVVGRALDKYSDLNLYAAVFLSNHLHFQLRGSADSVSRFMAYVKREITRRWGHSQRVNWRGTMWSEYVSTALPTAESQVCCLKYILSHGVKEGLIARPELWPGVHCARALMTGSTIKGEWLDATSWARQRDAQKRRKHPKPVRKNGYYLQYEVRFAPIPAWSGLDAAEYRTRVRALVDEIIEEGRVARNGRKPLGAKRIMAVPLDHQSELPPQPWFEERRRMICWADPRSPETRAYLERYWAFQREFRAASAAFRDGELDAQFPPGAFRPITCCVPSPQEDGSSDPSLDAAA